MSFKKKKVKSNANTKKNITVTPGDYGFVDGNTMSFFEVCDALQAMSQSIEKMAKNQIVAELQGFGYEPEDGFARASKKQLAEKLLYKKVDGTELAIMFGPGYSN